MTKPETMSTGYRNVEIKLIFLDRLMYSHLSQEILIRVLEFMIKCRNEIVIMQQKRCCLLIMNYYIRHIIRIQGSFLEAVEVKMTHKYHY